MADDRAVAAPSRCAAGDSAARARHDQPARLRRRSREDPAGSAREAGHHRPLDGWADRPAALRQGSSQGRRPAHAGAARQRDRHQAVQPAGLPAYSDELGVVAQASPGNARGGLSLHLQHDRPTRGCGNPCLVRARVGPRPVRDRAAMARCYERGSSRSAARDRASAVRGRREGPARAARRRAPHCAPIRARVRPRRIP